MIRPWKLLGESQPEDHFIFKLRTLEVEDPRNGSAHRRVVLDCPDWVNVLAFTEKNELILIRQFRFGVWRETLELPGGMVERGEDAAVAGARELEEETGYRPQAVRMMGVCEPNPAFQNNRLHCLLATGCTRLHDGRPDAGEDVAVELHARDRLPALVRDGTIQHSAVITALCFHLLEQQATSTL